MWYDKLLERISRLVPSFGGAGGKEEGRHGKADAGLSGSGHLHAGAGGCMFGNVDEMYALPKSSEAYVNLQAKINQEKGSAEYIAPLSGENRQTIQLVDVDGDGVQEAVAFFRDTTSENPLKIVIFKQEEHEEYQV